METGVWGYAVAVTIKQLACFIVKTIASLTICIPLKADALKSVANARVCWLRTTQTGMFLQILQCHM